MFENSAWHPECACGATMSVMPNLPMELSVSGDEVARSLTLVIHDSTQNFGTASTWKPTDVCHP